MSVLLSTNLDDPTSIPYFTWDDPMTVAEIRSRLREPASPERTRLLAKIMREARDTEVWKFTTPNEVSAQFPQLRMYLGRRRAFWDYLLGAWRKFGWVDDHRDADAAELDDNDASAKFEYRQDGRE